MACTPGTIRSLPRAAGAVRALREVFLESKAQSRLGAGGAGLDCTVLRNPMQCLGRKVMWPRSAMRPASTPSSPLCGSLQRNLPGVGSISASSQRDRRRWATLRPRAKHTLCRKIHQGVSEPRRTSQTALSFLRWNNPGSRPASSSPRTDLALRAKANQTSLRLVSDSVRDGKIDASNVLTATLAGPSSEACNYFLTVSVKILAREGEKGKEYIPVVAGLEADNAIDRWDGWERSVAQAECTVKVRIVCGSLLGIPQAFAQAPVRVQGHEATWTQDCSRNGLSEHGGGSSDGLPAASLGVSNPAETASRRQCQGGDSMDREREVARVDPPVDAVGDEGPQRAVQTQAQRLVLMAHRDPDALIEVDAFADEPERGSLNST